MNERSEPVLVYFGRHKAGSRYVSKILGTVASSCGWVMINASQPEPRSQDWLISHLPDEVKLMRVTPYPNEIRELLYRHRILFKGFHLYRDPRDMIVSGYFSHRSSHPERWNFQKAHFARLRELPKHEGMMAEINYTGWLELNNMRRWDYDDPNIKETKFEDMVADPQAFFTELFSFLGLEYPADRLRQILDQVNFQNLSGGRRTGEENITHHYRKGVPGDWTNHLDPIHLDYFNRHYGDLLSRLGYSETLDDKRTTPDAETE